jgi:acetyl-CoA carboxylase carboxyltransferase component
MHRSSNPLSSSEKKSLKELTEELLYQAEKLQEGGGISGAERQRRLGRMTARERLAHLLDSPNLFFELNLWAGYRMYEEWGPLPAAGVITGIGLVMGRSCMIIANDATVKAGAFFPQTVKKVLRAQRIAYECHLPILYLVDSSGVFLPLQDEVFPDEDDFGRIFRNNAVLSAIGIPQFAAIMGNCIAGGGYLPVLCDKLLMTEGSGLYLAGPALVKAAIGQVVDPSDLGGAQMHAQISGTVDFYEPDDKSCLLRLRALVDMLPAQFLEKPSLPHSTASRKGEDVYKLVTADCNKVYDVKEIIKTLVDRETFNEYKASYGKTLVTGYAKIEGMPLGIVANQRQHSTTARGEVEMGGVLYCDSADKAARFIMDCNQMRIPLLFLQDVAGFMVGKQAEQEGIIRSGAKLVNVVSNSIVPKITLLMGRSFGAGNYALGGKAYDPHFIMAWPNAQCAVMGASQAADTLEIITRKTTTHSEALHAQMLKKYEEQMDVRYAAARGWVDAIIAPHQTRAVLSSLLKLVQGAPLIQKTFHTGILQV